MNFRKCNCCLDSVEVSDEIANDPNPRFFCRTCRAAHALLDVANAASRMPCTGPCADHGLTCYGCRVRALAEAALRRCGVNLASVSATD